MQYSDNYGAVLVAYALQESINAMGDFKAESIDYRNTEKQRQTVKSFLNLLRLYGVVKTSKRMMGKIKRLLIKPVPSKNESALRKERFELFRKKYINRSDVYFKLTTENAPEYDIYLVGSDVVWGLYQLWYEHQPMFLDFTRGRCCRRISYAASLADNPMSFGQRKSVKKLYQDGFAKFDMISVREDASAEWLKSFVKEEVYSCLDPSLLLEASAYEKLLDQENNRAQQMRDQVGTQGYIYVYLLDSSQGNSKVADFRNTVDMVNAASKMLQLPVVGYCTQMDGIENVLEKTVDDGPVEFLNRIRNASLVITNSFHGVAFCIRFRRNFFVVRRGAQDYKINGLLKRFSLTKRFIKNSQVHLDFCEDIDYDAVYKELDAWREESLNYLRLALGSDKPDSRVDI